MKLKALKEARIQSGKTQVQVAKEIGVAETAYQKYEHGKSIPSVIMGNRIARSLGTTSEKIWGYEILK